MSRIEEALRRAGQPPAPEAGSPVGEAAPPSVHSSQPDEVAAPWDFSDTPAAEAEAANAELAFGEARTPRPTVAAFQGFTALQSEKLVVAKDAVPTQVEQFRKLAATLHESQKTRQLRIVMIASAVAGEGKTLTSTNLALTFSESYHRTVLLIDADLRRPSLSEVFQVPNSAGLMEGLTSHEDQQLPLVKISSFLTLLTAGRPSPDPMRALSSERMRRILQEAAARYDWVIIDTPPVAMLPDANLLASMVDGAVLVVRAASTPYRLVQKAVHALGRDRILGVVLNRAESAAEESYYYDAYYKRDVATR